MEIGDLTAEMEWEAQRVAAAFEMEQWSVGEANILQIEQGLAFDIHSFFGRKGHVHFYWHVSYGGKWQYLSVTEEGDGDSCDVCSPQFPATGKWFWHPHPGFNHCMAQGLYRLGCENEDLWRELDVNLSAHEKLELRLSLPREFWPQKWLDEEGT